MNVKLEKYLNDEMEQEERLLFELEIAKDPTLLAEMEAHRIFIQSLRTQMLREKIKASINERGNGLSNSPNRSQWIWGGYIVVFLMIVAFGFWHFSKNPTTTIPAEKIESPIPQNPPVEQPNDQNEPSPTNPPEESIRSPIAESRKVQPAPNQPSVRGATTEANDWDKFIESVWVTRFDPVPGQYNQRFSTITDYLKAENYTDAYVQLQLLEVQLPQNDTLAFLKGYCLLEMREGAEALKYFEKISNDEAWNDERAWYSALANLIAGKQETATTLLKKISADPENTFKKEARRTLKKLN